MGKPVARRTPTLCEAVLALHTATTMSLRD
jgi:hypothetical protein